MQIGAICNRVANVDADAEADGPIWGLVAIVDRELVAAPSRRSAPLRRCCRTRSAGSRLRSGRSCRHAPRSPGSITSRRSDAAVRAFLHRPARSDGCSQPCRHRRRRSASADLSAYRSNLILQSRPCRRHRVSLGGGNITSRGRDRRDRIGQRMAFADSGSGITGLLHLRAVRSFRIIGGIAREKGEASILRLSTGSQPQTSQQQLAVFSATIDIYICHRRTCGTHFSGIARASCSSP